MKKLLVIGLVTLGTLTSAYGGPRHGHHSGGHYARHYHGGHHHGRNYAPWVAGAIGLGIVGAIAGAHYYNRECTRVVVGYDNFGRPVTRLYCE